MSRKKKQVKGLQFDHARYIVSALYESKCEFKNTCDDIEGSKILNCIDGSDVFKIQIQFKIRKNSEIISKTISSHYDVTDVK